jgi:hypothetical protein
MRFTLIHAKRKYQPRNDDDSTTKAKHSRQQTCANAKAHQNERTLL